ncbi:hypothetical protein A3I18_00700 [Candidatus Campbellbacteria bacterium RIFCSPLOWO2_02_FULL_35_11]|uniref:Type II secretion system protein GspF domain-containing protein n=2 Tax=Candidatus Campbelliibacteriota TaxID=1752727 RepID=A0A1F5ENQ5_9BACT|nr:MAG: hypothetical protein A3E89_01250 [Candidatus Campbellbacteria bacterium RIFCSPHIGHO2_12_FULL_35_10]OGD69902.1 MAG: hypothetical protein A3I18_00700 [Candidatus Campbellbacteria bacterium RIFCSPLOWO2_02_FULL_35_11]
MNNKTQKKVSEPVLKKKKKFSSFGLGKEKDYFIENLSMLASSGMTIDSAVRSMRDEMRTKKMKEILDRVAKEVEDGSPVWKALDGIGIFSPHIISLVRVGEESGKLSENLRVVSLQEEKNRDFRSKINSAMMYPIFVLSLTLLVGVSIAWFILPRLALVFSQMNIKLPWVTQVLINLGQFLGKNGFFVVPIFFAFVLATFYLVFFFKKTKFIGQWLLFHLPGIKNLIKEIELARMGYLMGALLDAGLPITDAFDSLSRATTFSFYRNIYLHLKDNINEGFSIQKSFASYPKANRYIPSPIQQMIVAGEKSGSLSKTFSKIGETFERKTEVTTKNLSVILEPILLVIVWVGVVSVALAVILPIYGLIGGLRK